MIKNLEKIYKVLLVAELDEVQLFLENRKIIYKIYAINKTMKFIDIKGNCCIVISGIGKANSSSATTFILQNFKNLKIIINIGFCGSTNNLEIGSWVLFKKIEYSDLHLNVIKTNEILFHNNYIYRGKKFNDKFINKFYNNKKIVNNCWLLTSDSFINYETYLKLPYRFKKNEIYCFDMEGASILQICKNFLFKNLFVIKYVSDILSNSSYLIYKESLTDQRNNYWNMLDTIIKYDFNCN